MSCQFKSGFFLRRDCSGAGTQLCSVCSLSLCSLHQIFNEGQIFCPACVKGSGSGDSGAEDGSESATDGDDIQLDDSNPYRVRGRQKDQGHTIFSDSSFNTRDRSAFDSNEEDNFDDDDASKLDFGDS